MTKQEIFDFLKENMKLQVKKNYADYGDFRYLEVELKLLNPETEAYELITSDKIPWGR